MEKERISAPAAVLIAENPQVLNQFIRTELNVPDWLGNTAHKNWANDF